MDKPGAGGQHPGIYYRRVRRNHKAELLYFPRSSVLPALPLWGQGGGEGGGEGGGGQAWDSLFSDLDEAPLHTSLEQ